MTTLSPYFDIFLSSSALGMRKPEPRIYTHTLSSLNSFAKSQSQFQKDKEEEKEEEEEEMIKPSDIIFLDDIGENLKIAREQMGWRTIKVQMGKTWRAVKELEMVMGLKKGTLLDEKVGRAKL